MRKFTLNVVAIMLLALVGIGLFASKTHAAAANSYSTSQSTIPNTTGDCEVHATLYYTVLYDREVLNAIGHVSCTFTFAVTKITMELQHCSAEAFGTCFLWDAPVTLEDCSDTLKDISAVCSRNYYDLKSGLWQLTVTSLTITTDEEENDGWDFAKATV